MSSEKLGNFIPEAHVDAVFLIKLILNFSNFYITKTCIE